MGVLLIYPLLLVCMVVPSIMIYRSPLPTGWRKTGWVLACFLSAFAPVVLATSGIAIATKFGNYELTANSMMFGPEATVMAISNVAMLVLPWVIYLIFKTKRVKGVIKGVNIKGVNIKGVNIKGVKHQRGQTRLIIHRIPLSL